MIAFRANDLRQHSDVLRLRTGKSVTVRFVEPRDAEPLQGYFRSLSVRSRYNRFLGAMSELPKTELDHFIHVGEGDRFSVVAVMTIDGVETIVGEARYAFDVETASFEFGLSIDDRGTQVGLYLLTVACLLGDRPPVAFRHAAGHRSDVFTRLQPRLHPHEALPQQAQQLGPLLLTQPSTYPGGSSRPRFCCRHTRMIVRRLRLRPAFHPPSRRSPAEWRLPY